MNAAAPARPWRRASQGAKPCVIVRFRLTPKSSKNAIDGAELTADGLAFKAWVRAVPAEGQANEALMRLVCETLGLTKARVALVGGHKSRVKSLSVAGDVTDLETRLEAIWALSSTTIKTNS